MDEKQWQISRTTEPDYLTLALFKTFRIVKRIDLRTTNGPFIMLVPLTPFILQICNKASQCCSVQPHQQGFSFSFQRDFFRIFLVSFYAC